MEKATTAMDAARQVTEGSAGEDERRESPDVPAMDFTATARTFIQLNSEKKQLKARLSEIEEKMGEMQEPLSEYFIEQGISKISIDGSTLYVREEMWPKLVVPDGMTPEEAKLGAVHELDRMGHGRMLTYNTQSLRSLVKELANSEGELPLPLGQFIGSENKFKVAVTSSGSRKKKGEQQEEEEV